MCRTLSLQITDHLRDRIFRRNRDHHMHVIGHQMPFLDLTFLLSRQPPEHLDKLLADDPEKVLPAIFRNEYNVILTLPPGMA